MRKEFRAIVRPHARIVDLVFLHTMVKLDLCGPWPMVLFKFAPTVNCLDFEVCVCVCVNHLNRCKTSTSVFEFTSDFTCSLQAGGCGMIVGPHSTKLPQSWDTGSDQPSVPAISISIFRQWQPAKPRTGMSNNWFLLFLFPRHSCRNL